MKLTPTDIFVLALVRQGVNTLYLLQKKADLSPGWVRSIIDRLQREHLVRRASEGKRRARVMALTPKGGRALDDAVSGGLTDSELWDFESALRVLFGALQMSQKLSLRWLGSLSKQRESHGARLESEASRLGSELSDLNDPVLVYRWMRALGKSRQLTAEAKFMRELAERIKDLGYREIGPDTHEYNASE